MTIQNNDRFEGLTDDYEKLWPEVFAEKGTDYRKLERTVFKEIINTFPKLAREYPILDIGIGDGITLEPFVEYGCKLLTGYDLNPDMLEASRIKFRGLVNLVQGDACDMSRFKRGQYPIIITGMCIHNIPKEERVGFWNELKRLNPLLFGCIEKIEGDDKDVYEADYRNETAAMKRIFVGKYGLQKEADEWMKHYEYDERPDVKLTVNEVIEKLSPKYRVKVLYEEGMWKTILALEDIRHKSI